MLNVIGIWGDESTAELKKYNESKHNLINTDFELNFDTSSDIVNLVLRNLSA